MLGSNPRRFTISLQNGVDCVRERKGGVQDLADESGLDLEEALELWQEQ